MGPAIWWIRRDLRLTDNQALHAALASSNPVLPVFVLDPGLLSSRYVGLKRLAFLLEGLRILDADLRERGSRLVVRRGRPVPELGAVAAESGADSVFAEEDYSPYARARDRRVARNLPLHLVGGLTVHTPGSVMKTDGTPYTVFTPFSRKWRALTAPPTSAILPAPAQIPTAHNVAGVQIPEEPGLEEGIPFKAGEIEAQRRLAAFVDGHDPAVYQYAVGRNRVDYAGTSQLSPYLRFGMLSARQAVVSASAALDAAQDAQAQRGAATWLNELIWREFYIHILDHFPQVRSRAFRPGLRGLAWENDQAAFSAWRDGQTGYPIIDAAMRQLRDTGWLHNRARMIVASFLVKDLLIDWRWGEQWFMQHLVDGDPAANNGGWQWTAGTGTDAAPYFRIFNPVLQSKKHDPDGAFIRRWVPELNAVPTQYIHEPWRMPKDAQNKVGCLIGKDYESPIVDHSEARVRVIDLFRQAKEEFASAKS